MTRDIVPLTNMLFVNKNNREKSDLTHYNGRDNMKNIKTWNFSVKWKTRIRNTQNFTTSYLTKESRRNQNRLFSHFTLKKSKKKHFKLTVVMWILRRTSSYISQETSYSSLSVNSVSITQSTWDRSGGTCTD